jgi:multidrug efflux system membrane fusion protein
LIDIKRKFTNLKANHKLALIITVLIVVWILSGSIISGNPDQSGEIPRSNAQNVIVKVENLQSQSRAREVILYGTAEAKRRVGIIAETDGQVVEVVAKEGQLIKKGDVIIRVDQRERGERLQEAKARVNQRFKQLEAAKKLLDSGHISEISLAGRQADYDEAKADLASSRLTLDRSAVRAPFDGLLDEIKVKEGDYIGVPGFDVIAGGGSGGGATSSNAVAMMIDINPMIVVGYLSEKEREFVKSGMPAEVRAISGKNIEGVVRFISSVADSATRTYRLEVEVDNPDNVLTSDGESAEIIIPTEQVAAFKLSPAWLALDDAGNIGVKLLDDKRKVTFTRVRIFADEPDGIWVTDLSEEINIITQGQALVSDGEILEAGRIQLAGEKNSGEKKSSGGNGGNN